MLPISGRPISSIGLLLNMTDINKKVGKKIRQLRQKKGLSQEKLALEAGLHRAYIGQIERGEKNIGLKNLEIIAKTMGVKIRDVIVE